jgi:hypothetical protein
VNPLIRFALTHAKQTPVHHLERIGFQVDQNEEQAIFWRRERTVLVHREPAGGPGFPIEAPRRHVCLERGLEGRDQHLKSLQGQTREIEELCGAGLYINEPYIGRAKVSPKPWEWT